MPLKATWLGRDAVERIADLRMRCYGAGTGPAERANFLRKTGYDRSTAADVLVLSDDTGDVATATSLNLKCNIRGTVLPCQGVAWVGTVKSHRRRKVDGRGLASRVMDALADAARERGQAVSMLAPFRASYYESFGYGVVERQNTWTIPLGLMPQDDTDGFAEYRDDDFDACVANRQRQFRGQHGDVETDATALTYWLSALSDQGFRMVDRQGGQVTSQFTLATETANDQTIAFANRPIYDSPAALRRLLSMLGSLKDQYFAARITLPADLPINWWLRERQLPHRVVNHPVARCMSITRMQATIPDVAAFVAALRPTPGVSGVVNVGVESATYRIEIADGRATAATTTAAADVEMDRPTWAAVAFGDLKPDTAVALDKLRVKHPHALPLLKALTDGPTPYCHEYF